MRIVKKQILKEDGRYLVYYHSPESASAEQSAAYKAVEAVEQEVAPVVTSERPIQSVEDKSSV